MEVWLLGGIHGWMGGTVGRSVYSIWMIRILVLLKVFCKGGKGSGYFLYDTTYCYFRRCDFRYTYSRCNNEDVDLCIHNMVDFN